MDKNRLRDAARNNIVTIMFIVLCAVCMAFSGYAPNYVLYELFGRLSRNMFIVLSLIIPIVAGMGINFAITIGAMAAQIACLLVLEWGVSGIGGLALAALLTVPLGGIFGFLIGKLLNRMKGQEMIGSMILGYFANGLYQLLFLFIFAGGWGNGFGNNAGNSGGVVDGYVLTSDFANVERKIDSVNQGLCDGFYQQAQLVNGVQQTVNNGFMSAEISRANQQAAFMQQLFAMQMQQQECCCENRSAIQGVNYNLATQSCETRNTVQNTTRDIIDNQNQNARAILDALTAQRIEAKDAKIAEQGQQLFAAQLAASQAAQNETLKAYMSGQLAYYNPRPVPAFPVPAPYQYGNCGTGCGCNGCA